MYPPGYPPIVLGQRWPCKPDKDRESLTIISAKNTGGGDCPKGWVGRWGRSVMLGLGGVGLALGSIAPATAQGICVQELPRQMAAWLDQPALAQAHVGIALAPWRGELLYGYQSDRLFVPASNQKLLTTAVALDVLGQTAAGIDRTWTTPVYLWPNPDRPGTGELWIQGQGDPTITSGDLQALTDRLVPQLQAQGITTITRLGGDDRLFHGTTTPPTWEVGDIQMGYGTPINSLILNENAIGLTLIPQAQGQPLGVVWDDPIQGQSWQIANFSLTGDTQAAEFVTVTGHQGEQQPPILRVEGVLRVGSASEPVAIALPNPGETLLETLAQGLRQRGITVNQTQLITQDPTPGDKSLASHLDTIVGAGAIDALVSPSLQELVSITNKTSQNLYAEVLLRWLGLDRGEEISTPGEAPTSLGLGLQHLEAHLNQWGLESQDLVLADGSGLSRHNLITPQALAQVLQRWALTPTNPLGQVYRSSLASTGESGSLGSRFRGTSLEGHLWGKTGSMEGIAALSGYLDPPDFEPLVFVIFINQANESYGTLTRAIDTLLEQWVHLRPCR